MVNYIVFFMIIMLFLGVIYFDLRRKINLSSKYFMCIFLIIAPHITILLYFFFEYSATQKSFVSWKGSLAIGGILFVIYLLLKVNILPYSKKQVEGFRLRVLLGGRMLVLYSLYTNFVQILIYFILKHLLADYSIPPSIWVIDIIITLLFIVTLYINGMLRILFTSRRLNMIKKIIIVTTLYIPLVNLIEIIYVCSVAKSEYEHECYRVIDQNMRIDSAICKTKYPLVMIHGIGFKDFKYINYWGRIPKELIMHGATIYYGNQDAWGSIECNAQDIKNKILDIIKETGCEKVNLIAHSKGGLDARYMISNLDMSNYVATLTTISTPHRGSKMMNVVYHLPKWFYNAFGRFMNKYFKMIGDKNTDFFTACRQLSSLYCEKFNTTVTDAEQVYYQSYATVMKNMFSDYILAIPYVLLRLIGGENDGLVQIESAKWGEFKGVFKNKRNRGISHGDIIDLRKNDYIGFDVRKQYVDIVADLKDRGY